MDKSDTTSSAASEENSPREQPQPVERKKKRPQLKRTIAKVLDDEPGIDFSKLESADAPAWCPSVDMK